MARKSRVINQKVIFLANFLIIASLLLLVLIFAPIVNEEAKYTINSTRETVGKTLSLEEFIAPKSLTPPNTDFSIVVPKIFAVAPVIANVDSQNQKEYTKALRQGVAHAEGTVYPGEEGNTYLFAHSTDAFYNVGYYNAVFYLLGKLKKNDEIFVYYKGEKITYLVREIKIVDPDAIEYFGKVGEGSTLTLQTCYPPGTTLKRLVVIADKISSEKI